MIQDLFTLEGQRSKALVHAQLIADHHRCVECGICSFNCPIGIDIRHHVHERISISDQHCLACGECVSRCPRSVLHFEKSHIFSQEGGA